MDMPDEQMLKLSHEGWSQCFLTSLNELRHAKLMCDAKIVLNDGITLFTHSCVLAAASPFFKTLLDDKESPEIDMGEFPAELIKQVLEFIYTGEILVCKGEVEILYNVAQSLDIPVLMEILKGVYCSLQINVAGQSAPYAQSLTAESVSEKRGRGRPRKVLPVSEYHQSASGTELVKLKRENADYHSHVAENEITALDSSDLKREDAAQVVNSMINLDGLELVSDINGATNENRAWDYLQELRPVSRRKEWKALKDPVKVEDIKVPADGSIPDRAEKTLPYVLILAPTSTGDRSVRGVFAAKHLRKGATFGPYEGEIVMDLENSKGTNYCWKIYKNCKLLHWIDGQDESKANWMRFVRHADTSQEQNIEAFQHDGNLYFRSIRDILPQQELLVRYGNQYSAKLKYSPSEQPVDPETSIDGYTCTTCDKMYATDVMYWKHMRSVHGEPMPVEIYNKIQEERMKNQEDKKKAKAVLLYDGEEPESVSSIKKSPVWMPVPLPGKKDGQRKRSRGRPRKYLSFDYTGDDGHQCSVCHRIFKTPGILRQHAAIHSSDKPYKCNVCNKGFTQRGNLSMHMMAHTGERPFVCNICGKDFNRRGELKKHIIRHQGHRPFKCMICGKGFGDWGNLHRHKKIHTGEKPFKCHICGKTFSQTSNLRTHIKRHTGEKPHKCHMCEKCFGDLGHLRTHLRRHTGEKPFICTFCGKGFVDKQSMRKHSERHLSKPALVISPDEHVIFPSKNVISSTAMTTTAQ